MLSLYHRESLLYLLFSKDFVACRTLIHLISEPIIDEIIGKIDSMEAEGKRVDALEVLILTAVTYKVFPNIFHLLFLLQDLHT